MCQSKGCYTSVLDRPTMKLCVLITSVGGLVSPGIIENLRSLPEVSQIIGVDASGETIGSYMVDKYYNVPMGDDPEYVKVISDIASRENVNVMIPASDEEVFALSFHKKSFEKKGIAILCPKYEIVATVIDKGSMLSFLKQHNFPVPNFFLPTSIEEVIQAAERLGYPSKPVVVKPRRGRGGRGFRILRENINGLNTRYSNEMRLHWFIEAVKQQEPLEIVMEEYLTGEDYSVDVLADNGHLLFVVPRRRIRAILGPSQLGVVIWNQEIVDIVQSIVRIFGISFNVNIQLKYSNDHKPLVYEINPRISGTIVASAAAGVDLLREGIRYALGLGPSIPPMSKPKPLKMIRYLKEYFV